MKARPPRPLSRTRRVKPRAEELLPPDCGGGAALRAAASERCASGRPRCVLPGMSAGVQVYLRGTVISLCNIFGVMTSIKTIVITDILGIHYHEKHNHYQSDCT